MTRTALILALSAGPAFAHHEVAVVASTAGLMPFAAMLAAGALLAWHRWRGK